jgi:hypothetical protein
MNNQPNKSPLLNALQAVAGYRLQNKQLNLQKKEQDKKFEMQDNYLVTQKAKNTLQAMAFLDELKEDDAPKEQYNKYHDYFQNKLKLNLGGRYGKR